jgi:hypothetical protein
MPYAQNFEEMSFEAVQWTVVNPDNKITWEVVEVEGLPETTTAASIDFPNYLAIGQRDRFVSPPLSFEGFSNMNLNFKHAYAQRNPNYADSLIIYISNNCGQSWTRIFADAENGSGNFATHPLIDGFIPVEPWDWCSNGWGAACITLNLDAYAGQPDIRIAFESFSFYGNPMFITDIRMGPTVGLTDLEASGRKLVLSPNPTDGKLSISSLDGKSIQSLRVLDASGKQVYQANAINKAKVDLDLASLKKGMYIVTALIDNQGYTEKLLIQ